eukprot:CAMPEP_0113452504 /NCGR_PEP_ID=MMETSP0014_2-20120614/6881_1 /TAXON_ID=2857 /ORGANISM="Nitzschia sp." /LENGTH=446 /DNA_ID=CAMNT_0000343879 /DNA_START=215 /DNA_END=1555 /DNA_ORIENTATION=+ /assembly_acc=CAM_ASM_000159
MPPSSSPSSSSTANNNNNRNHRGSSGGGGGGMGMFTIFRRGLYNIVIVVLRTILYPITKIGNFLLPAGEFDGLNDAVTEKAAQQFVTYLKGLASASGSSSSTQQQQLTAIQDAFSTLGFSALRQEAVNTHSIILVYLHAPYHRDADASCKKVLLSSPMLEFITQPNIKVLGVSTQSSQGLYLANQLGATSFPVLALLQPTKLSSSSSSSSNNNRSSSVPVKLVFKAEGSMLTKLSSGQLVALLVATFQKFQLTVMEQEQRRIEREQADELRRQQDAEYQESLRADQERERQRREEQQEEQRLQREEEQREQQKVQVEQDRLNRARELLRPEPEKGSTSSGDNTDDDVKPTRIRFQLPTGQKLERRFWSDETIASLKAFLVLHFAEQYESELSKIGNNQPPPPHHHMIKNIALSENFPKKKHDDDSLSLRESGLCPQAVLMVQDLDA